MTVNLSALAGSGQQFFDNNGNPLSGGKLWSYQAGTTTPQTAYTTVSGNVAHTNPIILNSAGRVATGQIWLTAGENYKFSLFTSTDALIATWDNITGINGTGIATDASLVGYLPAGVGTVATDVQAVLRETVRAVDFGINGTGDETVAIKAALANIQSRSGAITVGKRPRVYLELGAGKTYNVSGNNPFGKQSASTLATVTYGIDFNGARIIWTPTADTDSLFGDMIDVCKLDIMNCVIQVENGNTTPRGYFMSSNCGARTDVVWYGYRLTNIQIPNYSPGRLKSVFKIDGVNLCSDTSVIGCEFQGFETFFDCSNPEAVVWDFVNCGVIPWVSNFTIFNITCPTYWSGGISVKGGSFITTTPGTWVKVTTPPTNTGVGNITIDTRTECRGAGVTMVEASAGEIVFKNASFFTGGGDSTSIDVKQKGLANVKFDDCFVFGNNVLYAFTDAEVLAFSSGFKSPGITYTRCRFLDSFFPKTTYLKASDLSAQTLRQVAENNLITSKVSTTDTVSHLERTSGVVRRSLSMSLSRVFRYSDTYVGGGLLGLSAIMSTGSGIFLGLNVLITSIKVNVTAVGTASYSKFGIAFGTASTTPLVSWNNPGQGLSDFEAIPDTHLGISIPEVSTTAAMLRFVAYNTAGGSWVATGALGGWVDITVEPVQYKQQLSSTEVVGLVSAWSKNLSLKVNTAATYTVDEYEKTVNFNTVATCTVTLPNVTTSGGRRIRLKNFAAFAVNSASSNVISTSYAGRTSVLLPATVGKWVDLEADIVNSAWVVVADNYL
jgi:hypothetical protein